MPSRIELEQMSQAQKTVWTKSLSALLKDLVHIATTNEVTLFEIRLLQNTPQPSTPGLPWQENAYTDRFARMTYKAIGELVKHLQEREQTFHITAALADSGCVAFAKSIEEWKPYADAFRRVDIVEGRASLTETRPVISALGSKRVRLFITDGSTAPAMSIGRTEVAKGLLAKYSGLTLYAMEPRQNEEVDIAGSTPWLMSLAGFNACSVKRFKYSENRLIEHQFDRFLVGQNFRDPINGWDPQDMNMNKAGSLAQIGIVFPVAHQTIVPKMPEGIALDSKVKSLMVQRSDYSKVESAGLEMIGKANLYDSYSKQEKAATNPVQKAFFKFQKDCAGNDLHRDIGMHINNPEVIKFINKTCPNCAAIFVGNASRIEKWNEPGGGAGKFVRVLGATSFGTTVAAAVVPHPGLVATSILSGAVALDTQKIADKNWSRARQVQEKFNSGVVRSSQSQSITYSGQLDLQNLQRFNVINGQCSDSFRPDAKINPIPIPRDVNPGQSVVSVNKYESLSSIYRKRYEAPIVNSIANNNFRDITRSNIKHLPTLNKNIGGVMLNTTARVEGEGTALKTGNVFLIFQNSNGVIDFMKLKRFATALWCTYLSVEGPGISIDPASKNMKKRKDKHKVRYIGHVRNTELGMVMRETDYLMKRWSVGTHRPDISNFLSPDDFDKIIKKKLSYRPSRFWLVPRGLTFKRSDNMLLLSSGQMTVQTEYLEDNPNNEKNEANELFAKWLTDNYGAVSDIYPVFRHLFEYSQMVSLCTYLRENRVPLLWFLLANREIIITEKSIDEVDQLIKPSGYKWFVTVYGGVEMQLDKTIQDENSYQYDASLADAETKIRTDLSDTDTKNKPVVFNANDTSYTVASKNTLKLFSTSADGDTIQTDLGLADEYHEKARGSDKNDWHLVAPRLELVRYYNPKLKTRAQFGNGWHLLVPFRLETEKQTSLPGASVIPKRLAIVNLLSGIREVLRFEAREGGTLRYVSEEKRGLTDSLVRQSNGAWLLKDRLGATFAFDKDGDLRQMVLRKDQKVSFKIGEKSYSKFIPGYSVEYRYDKRKIDGRDRKVLTAIKQGSHNARIDWQPDSSVPQIASVRVLRQGKVKPVEVLNYEYGEDGMLSRVTTQKGQGISIKYENNNMRVVVLQK